MLKVIYQQNVYTLMLGTLYSMQQENTPQPNNNCFYCVSRTTFYHRGTGLNGKMFHGDVQSWCVLSLDLV